MTNQLKEILGRNYKKKVTVFFSTIKSEIKRNDKLTKEEKENTYKLVDVINKPFESKKDIKPTPEMNTALNELIQLYYLPPNVYGFNFFCTTTKMYAPAFLLFLRSVFIAHVVGA